MQMEIVEPRRADRPTPRWLGRSRRQKLPVQVVEPDGQNLRSASRRLSG